eukprot:1796238-Amphidinium_carterae.1
MDYSQYQAEDTTQQLQQSPLLGTPTINGNAVRLLQFAQSRSASTSQSLQWLMRQKRWKETTHKVTVPTGDKPYIEQFGNNEQLHTIGATYRSWCPICVKAKGQPTHHGRGAFKEQSVLQLDNVYIKSNNPTNKKWQVHTILTGVETTTGLCLAIPTVRKGPTRYQLTQVDKVPIDTSQKVCDGEWVWTIYNPLTMSRQFHNLRKKENKSCPFLGDILLHIHIKDKEQWNDSTRQCSHNAERSGLTWWTDTIYNHLTAFQKNYFPGCYSKLASQSTDTWCIQMA